MQANRLLAALRQDDLALIAPHLTQVALGRETVLFEAGDDVTACHFPCGQTMISLIVALPDGTLAEAATVGREGAIGGIVSLGHKPAFTRGVVQIGGTSFRIDSERLEELKGQSVTLRDVFARYADCMIAQVLQSVACNVLHSLEPRFCRWLLTVQDRVGADEVPLTQEFLAEMLGVQRTTVTAVATSLQGRGLIAYSRGRITVRDRTALEAAACTCHAAVVQHFDRVLPGVYPMFASVDA
jgi:CRP-like cAMP-binding protein